MYLEGKLVRIISIRVPTFTDLGLYLEGSLVICVRFGASSLDFRIVGLPGCKAYSSLGHLTEQTLKIDEGQSIHIVSRAQLGAEGGL